jgi:hypothetical protein
MDPGTDPEAELVAVLIRHYLHEETLDRDESVKILKLLLGNLVKFPGEEKYQKLTFGRALNKIIAVTSGLQVLLFIKGY